MKAESVKRYEVPRYPEKKVVLRNPGILKTIPKRWKGNIKVGIALSSLLFLTLTACDQENSKSGEEALNDKPVDISNRKIDAEITPGQKAAPLFEHGEGIGSYGCVVVTPPVFLSEEEARGVIIEEAKKYGIKFDKDDEEIETTVEIKESSEIKNDEEATFVFLPKTSVSIIDKVVEEENGKKENEYIKHGSIILDGCDVEKKIGFEYVSEIDFRKWNPGFSESGIVGSYNIIKTAKTFTESIKDKTEDKFVGTFYDPMTYLVEEELTGKYDDKELEDKRLEISREQLREQVRDFIYWLKAQGVI